MYNHIAILLSYNVDFNNINLIAYTYSYGIGSEII